MIEIYGMTSVLYISFFLKKKGWQDGAHMRSQMCNPKDFSQDKIENVICGEGVGCIMSSREDKLEIRGWIFR